MGKTNFDELALTKAVAVSSVTTDMTANPNDNELKTKVNELITALKTVGVIK